MYEERLEQLSLYSLEFGRMRGEFIETYKSQTEVDRLTAGTIVQVFVSAAQVATF